MFHYSCFDRWGMGGPHGLFKRTFQDQQYEIEALHRDLKSLGWWGLSGPQLMINQSIKIINYNKRSSWAL